MQAWILDAGAPASFAPLTETRSLAAFPLANLPLTTRQQALLRAAGMSATVVPAGPDAAALLTDAAATPPALRDTEAGLQMYLLGSAWLGAEALGELAARSKSVMICDAHGDILGCLAEGLPARADVERWTTDDASMRLRYPWDLLRLNAAVLQGLTGNRIDGTVHPGATVTGPLHLGEGSELLPGVFTEGAVVIGRNSRIGPNCYLRGPTAIGNHCRIGQAVEIKASILMDRVCACHLSYVGDSIIGAGCNLAAGTITANLRHDGTEHRSRVAGQLVPTGRRKLGAILGDDVHTGIHTSIYPGRKLWPHCWTRPGAVVRHDLQEHGEQ